MDYTKQDYEALTTAASLFLKNEGRSKSSIKIYEWAWSRFIGYLEENNVVLLDDNVAEDYVKTIYGHSSIDDLSHYEKDHLRQCVCLVEFSKTGEMPKYINRKPQYEINNEFAPIINDYLDHKRKLRLSAITLRAHKWHLFQFSNYLVSRGVYTVGFISPLELMYYASTIFSDKLAAKNQTLIIVKLFLKFLYDNNYIKRNLSLVVPKDNYRKRSKLPSVYTKDEIRIILNSIDRSKVTGIRDYAIILLAARLGLRASDISALEFSNIKWSENTISIVQKKTGKPLQLPLPTDVGESIIDYLQRGRPISPKKSVFLSPRYPHNPIEPSAISNLVWKTIISSGVDIGNRKKSSHTLRHSMANSMINEGITLPIISEVLGHASVQSTMCYLRINVESMRLCAYEVRPIPTSFYEQAGGRFYE